MTDLSRILDDVFAGLGIDEGASLPTLPTSLPTSGHAQLTEVAGTSHTSHTSHVDDGTYGTNDDSTPSNTVVLPGSARVTSSYVAEVGNVGSVGREAKTPAGSTLPSFPQDLEDVGSVGRETPPCVRSFLDLNHAAPQRPEWLSADTLAALAPQLVPAPPPGAPLPISSADVRAGVARELRALAEDGREGPDALRDAVEITRAKIRNSEALAERQANGSRCHVCNGSLNDGAPVIAVLTGKRGANLFLHAGCHDAHSACRVALVDRIMGAAGYGAGNATGEAA